MTSLFAHDDVSSCTSWRLFWHIMMSLLAHLDVSFGTLEDSFIEYTTLELQKFPELYRKVFRDMSSLSTDLRVFRTGPFLVWGGYE